MPFATARTMHAHRYILALAALCVSGVSAHAADVYISEILADPPAGPLGDANGDGQRHAYEDEFIELSNASADTVDLTGWHLSDDDVAPEARFAFPEATLLPPGTQLLLFGGGQPTGLIAPAFVDDGRIGNGLSNGGDTILLIDANGDTVDRVDGNHWPTQQSSVRGTDGMFTAHLSLFPQPFSPGAHAGGGRTTSSPPAPLDTNPMAASIGPFIRQILADPPDDANGDGQRHAYEDEFIELFNAGTDTVALAGWQLSDDDVAAEARFSFPSTAILPPGARLLLFGGGRPTGLRVPAFVDDGRIGNGLSNGGDTILLINASGDTVDRVNGSRWPTQQSSIRPKRDDAFTGHATLYGTPYGLPRAIPTPDEQRGVDNQSTRSTRTAHPASAHIRISEVLASPLDDANGDGVFDAYADEFIELFNAGPSLDLSGWHLSDDDATAARRFTFPNGTIAAADSYVVLFGGGSPNPQKGFFTDDGRIGNGLSNGGDTILLIDANGDTVHSYAFPPSADGQSLHLNEQQSIPHGRLPARAPYSPGRERPLYERFDLVLPALRLEQRAPAYLRGMYRSAIDTIAATAAYWLSLDTNIAAVDRHGIVHARRIGHTRVEAWSDMGFLAQAALQTQAPLPPPNEQPRIISTPPTSVYASGLYAYQAQAVDPEGATLVFSLDRAPAGFRLDYASGLLQGRAPDQPGRHSIAFQVTDGRGGLARQAYELHVRPRPQLRISEVLADPPPGLAGDANGDGRRQPYADEFVEIVNVDSAAIDMSGMLLGDAYKSSFTFPEGTRIAPGQRIAVFGAHAPKGDGFFSADGRIGNGLDNVRDTVFLLSPDANDTLALFTYDLPSPPRQSLVWSDSRIEQHTSPGVAQRFSPRDERPLLIGLSIADVYLHMIQGDAGSPSLIAHWSTGRRVRIRQEGRWTSSDSSVIRVENNGTALRALTPGRSNLVAHLGQHATSLQPVTVYPPLRTQLVFTPADSTVFMRRGRNAFFSFHTLDDRPLSFTWYANGRRIPLRKGQISYNCCAQSVDTLSVYMRRGREVFQRRWHIAEQGASKPAVPPWAVSAYPNPFSDIAYFDVSTPLAMPAQLDIFDVRGRRVRTLSSPAEAMRWDGRDQRGIPAASGVYFYRVQQGAQSAVGKLVLLQ